MKLVIAEKPIAARLAGLFAPANSQGFYDSEQLITQHCLKPVLIQNFNAFTRVPDDAFFFKPLHFPVKRRP